MLREDLFSVTATVQGTDGKTWTAVFDSMKNGEVEVKGKKYRPGNGTENEVELGGAQSVKNPTLTRLYDETVDAVIHWLIQQAGRADLTIYKQPIDSNGAPYGHALIYRGRMLSVTPPDSDSQSENAALLTIEHSALTPIG